MQIQVRLAELHMGRCLVGVDGDPIFVCLCRLGVLALFHIHRAEGSGRVLVERIDLELLVEGRLCVGIIMLHDISPADVEVGILVVRVEFDLFAERLERRVWLLQR